VAHKKLGKDLVTSLTQAIMSVRRNLLREQPIFAQITAPSTDQDAYLPLHPGAAAVYNSTTQSFMDEYGNWIYLTPMALGGAATMLAAAWKFLGIGNRATEGPLDSLYALARRIRRLDSQAELSDIEEEIDNILKAELAKSAAGDESAVDDATLNVAAHRLESLIHDRRALLAKRPATQMGHSRPGRASSKSGHVRCTAESRSRFRATRVEGITVQSRGSAKRLINPTTMVGTPMAMQSVVLASIQIAPAPIIPTETR
jgi:hypothetical protein